MALMLIPNGLENINRYYIRFDFSTYTVLEVDHGKCTVRDVNIKDIENTLVFVRPLDPYKLHEARVYDSSSFRMVLCFFDRYYVTAGTMRVLKFDAPADYMREMRTSLYHPQVFSPFTEGRESNPWRTIKRDPENVWLCDFAPVGEGLDPGISSTIGYTCTVREEVDGSLTLWSIVEVTDKGPWETNNFSTGDWRLVSAIPQE